MLGLHYETPRQWASQALTDPAALLLDHLFCERKAAAMALHTQRCHVKRFPALRKLMTELAAEEFEHAERVEAFLKEYGKSVTPMGGNPYAQGLRRLWRDARHDMFLDEMLVCSLIEARSAERFRLLADAARGSSLGNFYEDLYASEVNHYTLFVGLCTDIFGDERTTARLEEMRAAEAALILSLPPGNRVHSGPG